MSKVEVVNIGYSIGYCSIKLDEQLNKLYNITNFRWKN